jgi:Carboxypeptidase regulatory-like domain/TonB dependent receptor
MITKTSKGAVILFLAACFVCPAWSQVTNARLSGVVTDPSRAVVPGAKITAKNTGTGLTLSTTSDSSGAYEFPLLPPGSYTVTTDAQGFSELVRAGIVLTVSQPATLNLTMQPGAVSQTVTVVGDAEQLNTTTAEIGQVMQSDEITDLPLNGRDPSSLVDLAAGTTNELFSQASTLPGQAFPTESGASSGGGRQGSAWYLLDGVANMDTIALLAAPFPNADATQEFRVDSNLYDARYGFAPSAAVIIQTKSGTNSFHGGLFEFIRNNDLNASNWFTGKVDLLKRNQFGGFVGGPILRNKLFFFTNEQFTRSNYSAVSNSTYTPTQAMINGDFSALPATNLNGPLTPNVFHTVNGVPNQVNPALFSPGALAIAKSLPLGTTPSSGLTYYVQPPQIIRQNENTSRLDYDINPSQRLFLRSFLYNYTVPGATIPGNLLAGITGDFGTYLNLAVGHTWTISPSLVNSATLSWSELDYVTGTTEKNASGQPVCLSEYIQVNDPAGSCFLGGLTAFDGNTLYGGGLGFSVFSGGAKNDTNRRYWWFTDSVSKMIGKHSITVGADVMHRYDYQLSPGGVNPGVDFTGQYTGFPLADFLLGYMNTFSQGSGSVGSTQGWMPGFYAQDQIKLRSNLTITPGLRWEPSLPQSIKDGRGVAFIAGQQSTRFPNAPLGLVFPGDTGISNSLFQKSYGYFMPRLGIAWQPHNNTSVRSGFGMYTTPMEDAFYSGSWATAPFAPAYSLTGGAATPLSFDTPWAGYTPTGGKSPFPPFASPTQVPASNVAFTPPIPLGSVFQKNLKIGLTESWNLSVDQQFAHGFAFHLGYVGSLSYHMATTVDLNPGQYSAGNARTTYPNFVQIKQVQDGGTGTYHALQVSVDKLMGHGLKFHTNFTWSHTTDVGGSGDPSYESSVSDPYSIRHDYGPSSLNYPFVWVSDFLYQFPQLRGSSLIARSILNGWIVSGLYTAESGPPFTMNGGQGNNNSGFDIGQDRADVVPNQPYGVRQGGKSNWINHYFNTAAFTNNAPGTPGDSLKFLIQEAPTADADLAVLRNFKIHESYVLQFRWEAFNALNHPSFGQPDSNPGDANFGAITSIGNIPPRVMQGALKFTF